MKKTIKITIITLCGMLLFCQLNGQKKTVRQGVIHPTQLTKAIQKLPDLVIENMFPYRGEVDLSNKMREQEYALLKIIVRNKGQQTSKNCYLRAKFGHPDNPAVYYKIPPIHPTQKSGITLRNFQFITFGNRVIEAYIDPDNSVKESNEHNNEMKRTFKVAREGLLLVKLTSPDSLRHVGRNVCLIISVQNKGGITMKGIKYILKCERQSDSKGSFELAPIQGYHKKHYYKWYKKGKYNCHLIVQWRDRHQNLTYISKMHVSIKVI